MTCQFNGNKKGNPQAALVMLSANAFESATAQEDSIKYFAIYASSV